MNVKKSIEGKICVNESKVNLQSNLLKTISKFNIYAEKFKKLNLIKNKNKLSFEKYNKLIFDDKTIDIFTNILEIFLNKKINKTISKSILSIYIFRNFQDREFTENSNTEIKFKGMVILLVNETNKIMNNYYSYIYKRTYYQKIIEKYLIFYLEFMNEKKFNKLNIYIKKYKKYENTYYYIKTKNISEMNNFIIMNLKKGMKYFMDKGIEASPEFNYYIKDFTVINKLNYDKKLLDKFINDYYLVLRCCLNINKYEKLKNQLNNIKQEINLYLNTNERILFFNIIKIEDIIEELEENKFNNEKFKNWTNKIFEYLKPILKDYNFFYDNKIFEESLTDNMNENFIILIKFFNKIFDVISRK